MLIPDLQMEDSPPKLFSWIKIVQWRSEGEKEEHFNPNVDASYL